MRYGGTQGAYGGGGGGGTSSGGGGGTQLGWGGAPTRQRPRVAHAAPRQRQLGQSCNKRRIVNALLRVCLAGKHLDATREAALGRMETHGGDNFVILFRQQDSFTYRALYAREQDTHQVVNAIHGLWCDTVLTACLHSRDRCTRSTAAVHECLPPPMQRASSSLCREGGALSRSRPTSSQ